MSTQFRWLKRTDYPRVLEIVHDIWEGDDYVPQVFNKWIQEIGSYVRGLFVDNELVGFSRLKILSDKIGWLQGLRVDPREQGKGYGKEIARRMVDHCFSLGLKELWFSTYFDNKSSISIHERLGFTRIGVFTNLYKSVESPGVVSSSEKFRINSLPGRLTGGFWNSWAYYPEGIDSPWQYLPEGLTLTDSKGGDRLILARSIEFGSSLEICTVDSRTDSISADLILFAERLCYNRGHDSLHVMIPQGTSSRVFLENGFAFFEKEDDVYLYWLAR